MRHRRNIDANRLAAQMQRSTIHKGSTALAIQLNHIFMRLTNVNDIQTERLYSGERILIVQFIQRRMQIKDTHTHTPTQKQQTSNAHFQELVSI